MVAGAFGGVGARLEKQVRRSTVGIWNTRIISCAEATPEEALAPQAKPSLGISTVRFIHRCGEDCQEDPCQVRERELKV